MEKQDELQQTQELQEQPIEASVDEILNQLQNKTITLDDVEALYQDGQMSEETYNEVMSIYQGSKIDQIVEDIANGKLTPEDLDNMLASGEITEDEYNQVLSTIGANDVPEEQAPQTELEPTVLTGNYKEVHLLDQFILLKKYIELYLETFKDVEIDQLSTYQVQRLAGLFKLIKKLQADLTFYIDNNYELENYNKNIYSYQLFNRSFAENIQKFRKLLNLNPNDIIDETKKKDK